MIRESGSSLDALRARGLTSFQLRLLAASTGCPVTAAEADAQAVAERIRRGPVRVKHPEAITAAEAARILTEAFTGGKFTGERLL